MSAVRPALAVAVAVAKLPRTRKSPRIVVFTCLPWVPAVSSLRVVVVVVVVAVFSSCERFFPGSGGERGGLGGLGSLHGVHGGLGQGVREALPHRLPEVWIEGEPHGSLSTT